MSILPIFTSCTVQCVLFSEIMCPLYFIEPTQNMYLFGVSFIFKSPTILFFLEKKGKHHGFITFSFLSELTQNNRNIFIVVFVLVVVLVVV